MRSNLDTFFATKRLDFGENLGPKKLCLFVVIRALGLLGAVPGVQYVFGTFFELFWVCPGGACTEISKKFERSFRDISWNSQRPCNGFAGDFATSSQRIGDEMVTHLERIRSDLLTDF